MIESDRTTIEFWDIIENGKCRGRVIERRKQMKQMKRMMWSRLDRPMKRKIAKTLKIHLKRVAIKLLNGYLLMSVIELIEEVCKLAKSRRR